LALVWKVRKLVSRICSRGLCHLLTRWGSCRFSVGLAAASLGALESAPGFCGLLWSRPLIAAVIFVAQRSLASRRFAASAAFAALSCVHIQRLFDRGKARRAHPGSCRYRHCILSRASSSSTLPTPQTPSTYNTLTKYYNPSVIIEDCGHANNKRR